MFPPLGAQTPASRILRINSFGTGSGFNLRIERVDLMISNKSAVLAAASGIAFSVMCATPLIIAARRRILATRRASDE
jgi:hypothetical protein